MTIFTRPPYIGGALVTPQLHGHVYAIDPPPWPPQPPHVQHGHHTPSHPRGGQCGIRPGSMAEAGARAIFRHSQFAMACFLPRLMDTTTHLVFPYPSFESDKLRKYISLRQVPFNPLPLTFKQRA